MTPRALCPYVGDRVPRVMYTERSDEDERRGVGIPQGRDVRGEGAADGNAHQGRGGASRSFEEIAHCHEPIQL